MFSPRSVLWYKGWDCVVCRREENPYVYIGSFKDKKEMLPAVQNLMKIGFKLFTTSDIADFLQEHKTTGSKMGLNRMKIDFLGEFGLEWEIWG